MLNSGVYGLIIGLILVYFLLSLACSAVNELIETVMHRRAKYLEAGIFDLLGPLAAAVWHHPLIDALRPQKGRPSRIPSDPLAQTGPKKKNPSYIPARALSGALATVLQVAHTYLSAPVDERSKSVTVRSSLGFPKGASFTALLDSEQISVSINDGTWTIERGQNGTKATTHPTGAAIIQLARPLDVDAFTSLHDAVDDKAESIVVYSSAGFPPSQPFDAAIEDEQIVVSAVTANTWSVKRGQRGTQAAGHAANAVVRTVGTLGQSFDELRHVINDIPEARVREPLLSFMRTAGADITAWRATVETWYDDKMDRVSGWYKRRTKFWLFLIGVAIVGILNADTVVFARTLWSQQAVRDAVVAEAQHLVCVAPTPSPVPSGSLAPSPSPAACTSTGGTSGSTASFDVPSNCGATNQGTTSDTNAQNPTNPFACIGSLVRDVGLLGLPLGWPRGKHSDFYTDPRGAPRGWPILIKVLGLLATALALAMGAPFWFDILNKFVNFRAAGTPPARSNEQGSSSGSQATSTVPSKGATP